jgi:hypothetical protein
MAGLAGANPLEQRGVGGVEHLEQGVRVEPPAAARDQLLRIVVVVGRN